MKDHSDGDLQGAPDSCGDGWHVGNGRGDSSTDVFGKLKGTVRGTGYGPHPGGYLWIGDGCGLLGCGNDVLSGDGP